MNMMIFVEYLLDWVIDQSLHIWGRGVGPITLLDICFTIAISCTELLVIALSLVILLRLGFRRNFRSVKMSFFILETERTFLRNPNLNEIISLHLYLCQHLDFYTFKFQTFVYLPVFCTYLISMISLIFILFSRIISLQSAG